MSPCKYELTTSLNPTKLFSPGNHLEPSGFWLPAASHDPWIIKKPGMKSFWPSCCSFPVLPTCHRGNWNKSLQAVLNSSFLPSFPLAVLGAAQDTSSSLRAFQLWHFFSFLSAPNLSPPVTPGNGIQTLNTSFAGGFSNKPARYCCFLFHSPLFFFFLLSSFFNYFFIVKSI